MSSSLGFMPMTGPDMSLQGRLGFEECSAEGICGPTGAHRRTILSFPGPGCSEIDLDYHVSSSPPHVRCDPTSFGLDWSPRDTFGREFLSCSGVIVCPQTLVSLRFFSPCPHAFSPGLALAFFSSFLLECSSWRWELKKWLRLGNLRYGPQRAAGLPAVGY